MTTHTPAVPEAASAIHPQERRTTGLAALAAVATALALIISMASGSIADASAAAPSSYSSGSLVIPMDTDTSGNHTAYNQNTGMWKSYGLVYRLNSLFWMQSLFNLLNVSQRGSTRKPAHCYVPLGVHQMIKEVIRNNLGNAPG